MPKQYSGLGLTLLYPDTWTVSEETADGRPTVSLENPAGSFLSISSLPIDDDPEEIINEAADAMNAEYEDVETEDTQSISPDKSTLASSNGFIISTCWSPAKLLSVRTDDHLYLVQIQGEDRDMDQHSMVFDAILTSMLRSLRQEA